MRFLTRDEIANPTELKVIDVPTPELGEDFGVRLMEMGSAARFRLRNLFGDEVTDEDVIRFYAELLCESLVDEDRKRLFTDPGDVKAFCERDSAFIMRLGEEASQLSGIGAGDIEDEVKN
jgi:hypothetical protein